MFKLNRILVPAIVLAVLATLPLLGQPPQYNRSTEQTLEGNTIYVATNGPEIRAIMKDGAYNEIEVRLAPSDFLASQGVEFTTGDSIRVVGSRVKINGCDVILAREVTRKGKTAVLRERDGKPLW